MFDFERTTLRTAQNQAELSSEQCDYKLHLEHSQWLNSDIQFLIAEVIFY